MPVCVSVLNAVLMPRVTSLSFPCSHTHILTGALDVKQRLVKASEKRKKKNSSLTPTPNILYSFKDSNLILAETGIFSHEMLLRDLRQRFNQD